VIAAVNRCATQKQNLKAKPMGKPESKPMNTAFHHARANGCEDWAKGLIRAGWQQG
jgi:hypothetical protein